MLAVENGLEGVKFEAGVQSKNFLSDWLRCVEIINYFDSNREGEK